MSVTAEDEELDALRRRLYAPGAGREDVARYAAATTGAPEEPAVPDAPPPDRGRRRPILVVGIAVLAAVAVAAAVGTAAGHPMAVPTSSPSPSGSPASDGVDEADLPVPASVRVGLIARLNGGEHAGLLDLLEADPGLLPPQLRTVGRADSIEYSGEGTTTFALSPSALADRGGRVTVIVVLAQPGRYTWRASRLVQRPTVHEKDVASHAGAAGSGAPVAATVGYGRGAPSRLTVLVPDGTHWGAVVVFTD